MTTTNNTPDLIYPDGISPITGDEAWNLELNRRKVIDIFRDHNYQYVVFPIVDFVQSLVLTHNCQLEKDTYVINDRISGKPLGIRADMTPQAIKLDKHQNKEVNRICYADITLQSKAKHQKQGRQIMQIGAEIFGLQDITADIENIELLITILHGLGLNKFTIDIGHMGLYTLLDKHLKLDKDDINKLFNLLQSKQTTELQDFLQKVDLERATKSILLFLCDKYGEVNCNIKTLQDEAKNSNDSINKGLLAILQDVQVLCEAIESANNKHKNLDISLHFDLCETRGYHYKSGIVFAVYHHQHSHPIAMGGRYDNSLYEKSRPSTGFSANLLLLTQLQGNGHGL